MLGLLRRLVIKNIVSPYGLALISLLIFLFAWLFPPDLYTHFINEPDYMFLDGPTLVFFLACFGAFILGVRSFGLFIRPNVKDRTVSLRKDTPVLYVALPLVIGTIANGAFLIVLGGKINFFALLANQQGDAIKSSLHAGGGDVAGALIHTIAWLTGILWWSLYRVNELRVKGKAKIKFYILFSVGFAVNLATCVATASRGALMPLVIGSVIIAVYSKVRGREVKVGRILAFGTFFFVVFIGLFLALSYFRGAGSINLLAFALIGYTVASYNRLAALLGGFMHFQFGGQGIYLAPILVENGALSSIMGNHFGWPPYFSVWQSEFSSTALAGLNKVFIWSGVFGYVYADLGWFAPLYIWATGFFLGWSWNKFKNGTSIGLVIYPFVAFWILFWLGSNVIWGVNFFEFLLLGFGLKFYDYYWIRVKHEDRLILQRKVPC